MPNALLYCRIRFHTQSITRVYKDSCNGPTLKYSACGNECANIPLDRIV